MAQTGNRLFLNLFTITISLTCGITALPASSSSSPNVKRSHLAIDIESCTCTPLSTVCEVTISSSVFGESHCPDKYHFCCVARKSLPPPSAEMQQKSNVTSTAPTPTTRIKIVVPTTPIPSEFQAPNTTNNTQKRRPECRCKLREKCPERFTDYTFGFHCTYDKVRCCEPVEDDGVQDSNTHNTTGRLINVFTDPETEKLKDNCRCLPEARCNISPDKISKRKDTVCPDNLIQCCGEMILAAEKKSDDQFDSDSEESIEKISKGFNPPSKSELSGALREGLSAHQRPVEIPQMKIPEEETVAVTPATSTLPPPTLPTQYYYAPQAPQQQQYQHRYMYAPVTQRIQNPYYYVSGDPGSHRYGDTYLVNHNGRGFKVAGKSSSSIFSNLASLLG